MKCCLRPSSVRWLCRAEATDVANAVLDGVDGVMLGAETLRGKYPAITVKTVLAICRQAEEVFDYSGHFEWLTLQGELVCPMPLGHLMGCGDSRKYPLAFDGTTLCVVSYNPYLSMLYSNWSSKANASFL